MLSGDDVCDATAACGREPPDAGQRPGRGAGFANHAFLFSSSAFISYSPNACFAGLSTRTPAFNRARERVKEEMLVSEADSPPQTRRGRLHCPDLGSISRRRSPYLPWLIDAATTPRTAAGIQDDQDDRNDDHNQKHGHDHPSTAAPGSKSRPPSTGCRHCPHRPTFSPVASHQRLTARLPANPTVAHRAAWHASAPTGSPSQAGLLALLTRSHQPWAANSRRPRR